MNRFLEKFSKAESFIGAILLGCMVTISFLNVLTRYFFHFSLAFTEELTLYMFVWVTLLGISLAFKDNGNMCVSLLYDRFPKGVRKVLYYFISLMNLIFFVTLMYWGFVEVLDEYSMGVNTEAMGLPVWFFTISMPIISLLILARIVFRFFKDVKDKEY